MAKAKKLPSGNWRVQASIKVNGETFKRSFTEATAKKAEKKAEEWQESLKMIGSDYSQMTVKEAIEFYIATNERKLSPPTVNEYIRISKNDMQDIINKPLYALTCPIIDNSINKALETLSPKTIKNRYGLLKRILTVYHPTFVWSVTFPESAPVKKREFSNEYIKSILNAAKGEDFELEIYLGILSLRESEICGLKWDVVDWEKKTVDICRSKLMNKNKEYEIVDHNKTNLSTRTVYLPDYVYNLLKERYKNSKSEFITEVLPNRFWQKFNTILKKENIASLKFHGLRHIYSSLSSALKIDAEIRMLNGGWASEKIMDGSYRHPITEEQINANLKINNYINEAIKLKNKTSGHKKYKVVKKLFKPKFTRKFTRFSRSIVK